MADLSAAIIALQVGIGALLARNNQIVSKQEDVLEDIERTLKKEFERLENRVNNLLEQFDQDIKATTSINYEMSQVLQGTKIVIDNSLLRIHEILQDLKVVSLDLLIEHRLAKKRLGPGDEGEKERD